MSPARLSVPDTLDHLTTVIEDLDRPPIIMAHSFGGTLTQVLVTQGLGAAAVLIDSAPPEGVRVIPPSQIKSLFPVLANPANRHRAVGYIGIQTALRAVIVGEQGWLPSQVPDLRPELTCTVRPTYSFARWFWNGQTLLQDGGISISYYSDAAVPPEVLSL